MFDILKSGFQSFHGTHQLTSTPSDPLFGVQPSNPGTHQRCVLKIHRSLNQSGNRHIAVCMRNPNRAISPMMPPQSLIPGRTFELIVMYSGIYLSDQTFSPLWSCPRCRVPLCARQTHGGPISNREQCEHVADRSARGCMLCVSFIVI